MNKLFLPFLIVSFIFFNLLTGCKANSKSENEKLKTIRQEALQNWKEMKFGMFIHWGVYSIPAGVWEGKQIEKLGEQIQRHAKIPHEEYEKLASRFNPVNFDPEEFVLLAKNCGMKYINNF